MAARLMKLSQSKKWTLECLPAGIVKMSSGFYTSNGIPSNGVVLTFGDSKITMGADPALIFFGTLAG
jgi:hypothetical protein